MPVGIALVLIFVLYLIDKHHLWKTALKITIYTAIAAAVIGGGLIGWGEYKDAQREKEEEAETARQKPFSDCVNRNVQFSNAFDECGKNPTVVLHAIENPVKAQPVSKSNVRRVKATLPTNLRSQPNMEI